MFSKIFSQDIFQDTFQDIFGDMGRLVENRAREGEERLIATAESRECHRKLIDRTKNFTSLQRACRYFDQVFGLVGGISFARKYDIQLG